MKKFWSLMLVALVMLGATACTEHNDSVDVSKESLSFYAEITNDATRADLEYDADNKVWNTVWEGNETISVIHYNDNGNILGEYAFINSVDEPNKFTCNAEGVAAIKGGLVALVSLPADEKSRAEELKEFMEQNRLELNTRMPAYSKISAIEIIEGGFEHTPKQSIKRFLYN